MGNIPESFVLADMVWANWGLLPKGTEPSAVLCNWAIKQASVASTKYSTCSYPRMLVSLVISIGAIVTLARFRFSRLNLTLTGIAWFIPSL